jgi:hypothetical protein
MHDRYKMHKNLVRLWPSKKCTQLLRLYEPDVSSYEHLMAGVCACRHLESFHSQKGSKDRNKGDLSKLTVDYLPTTHKV